MITDRRTEFEATLARTAEAARPGGRRGAGARVALQGRAPSLQQEPRRGRSGDQLRHPGRLRLHHAARLHGVAVRPRLQPGLSLAELGAPVRHRRVRPRPVRAHGARRPGLRRDRLRGDVRDHDRRHRLRRDLGLRRRLARQRDDALPRRALRSPLPPVRDHHARDLRDGQLLDDGRRADRRLLVHHGEGDAGADNHPQGERLRARRARGRGALVPGAVQAPAPEHARDHHRLRLPRAPRRRARRGVPVLPRPRDQPAEGLLGHARAGRLRLVPVPPVPHRRPQPLHRLADPERLLRRRRPPRRARPADRGRTSPRRAAVALLEVNDLRTVFKTREGEVHAVDGVSFAARAWTDARDRRRVRLRQVGHRELDHGHRPAAREGRRRLGDVRRPRAGRPQGVRAREHPRHARSR